MMTVVYQSTPATTLPFYEEKSTVADDPASLRYMQSLVQAFSEASSRTGKRSVLPLRQLNNANQLPNAPKRRPSYRYRRVSEPSLDLYKPVHELSSKSSLALSHPEKHVNDGPYRSNREAGIQMLRTKRSAELPLVKAKRVREKENETERENEKEEEKEEKEKEKEKEDEDEEDEFDEYDEPKLWAARVLEGELQEPIKVVFESVEPSPVIPPLDFHGRWSFTKTTLDALAGILENSSSLSLPMEPGGPADVNQDFVGFMRFDKPLPNLPKHPRKRLSSTVPSAYSLKHHLTRLATPVHRPSALASKQTKRGSWSLQRTKRRRSSINLFVDVEKVAELGPETPTSPQQYTFPGVDISGDFKAEIELRQKRVGRSVSLDVRNPEDDGGPSSDAKIRRSWSNVDIRSLGRLLKRATSDVYNRPSQKTVKDPTMLKNALSNTMSMNQHLPKHDIVWTLQMDTPEQIRALQVRRFIAQEIFTTEQTYSSHLDIVKTMFMEPFIAAASTPQPLVNPNDISIIFSHITDLIKLSSLMVAKLHKVTMSWHESEANVGQVFMEHEEEFDVYIRYAVNWNAAQKSIKKANSNILYRRFIQESLRKKETNRLGLVDYMIIPIQRITRYCLLLKDLKRHTSPHHPDYKNIDAALTNICIVAMAMNNVQKFR